MTANEIVKALREAADGGGLLFGRDVVARAAADLIEQQQAEIKQLEHEWEEAVCTATEFESQVYELQKEIERLKAEAKPPEVSQ